MHCSCAAERLLTPWLSIIDPRQKRVPQLIVTLTALGGELRSARAEVAALSPQYLQARHPFVECSVVLALPLLHVYHQILWTCWFLGSNGSANVCLICRQCVPLATLIPDMRGIASVLHNQS